MLGLGLCSVHHLSGRLKGGEGAAQPRTSWCLVCWQWARVVTLS